MGYLNTTSGHELAQFLVFAYLVPIALDEKHEE